jgi:RNA polymerase sigma-70 factor (ECF subfamily)
MLRVRLLVGDSAKIKEYRGTGPLAGWVRTASVRTALNLKRARARVEEDVERVEFEGLLDSKSDIAKRTSRADLVRALESAVAQLDSSDRLLLRSYYLDNLTMAKIAIIYKVSIATVFRRLNAATDNVLVRVKEQLAERLRLSADSIDSMIRDLRGEVDLGLSHLFKSAK